MNYDTMAETYARNRHVNDAIIAELRAVCPLGPQFKVLEVGCGTAAHVYALISATGCRGWGLEPSREMGRRAPVHDRLTVVEGVAESMPFHDAFFDLVFSVNVIHHVGDRVAHLREAFRVLHPGGMACTVTDSTEMIQRRKPLSEYWPSSVQADIARYPTVDSLLEQMAAAGFVALGCRNIASSFLVTDSGPYREKSFSCLRLISQAEFASGLQRLEADLRSGPVQGVSEYACIWGKVPAKAVHATSQ